ncbi:MAG: two-component sensor histidine kinase [Chitinophagaceae bacterium]|nr:MAG: two-component sensor histidine kinase [Chitinophagaceae bacterium]
MPDNSRKQIRRATFIYWLMLTYIVAALAWWFISLEKQNHSLADFRLKQLNATIDSTISPSLYRKEFVQITAAEKRVTVMHLSEGLFFLALIIFAAAFVFRSVRRQFRLQQQQQNFMMAVTHELKTPIAVARLNLETMQKYTLEPEKQKRLIRTTLEETSRLNFLTNNILISSQLEGGYSFAKEELDLSDLLKDCLQDFRNRFPDRTFNGEVEADVDVKGDAMLLQILINNLLENAVKYSPKESAIIATLAKSGGIVQLSIADQGPGIPDEEKKRIFRKFYRIGNEATRKTQGTGLGLYLCSKIAHDHNADISVTNNNPHGTNFAVTFNP